MSDTIITVNSPDPVKAFEALARIIGDKEGVDIALKSLKKKEGKERENGLFPNGGKSAWQAAGFLLHTGRTNKTYFR